MPEQASKFHSYEDFATIMLGFEDQKVAIIASNWITPKKVRTFNAVCTEGIISGDFITQEIRIDEAKRTIIPRREKAASGTSHIGIEEVS